MPRNVPVARQARLLAVIAVAGAAPLTAGVILWVIGTALQAGSHGHWAATAGTGEALIMAGLLCGLCMFVLAANSVRWTPRVPASRVRRILQPLASPEQQAWLAGQPRPEPGPPSGPPSGRPPGLQPRPAPAQPGQPPGLQPGFLPPAPVPPGPVPSGPAPQTRAYASGEFPPDRPWAEGGAPPDWPAYPDPGEAYQPYLAHPGRPDPGAERTLDNGMG